MPNKAEFSKILNVDLKKRTTNPQLLNNDRLNYQRNRIEARVQYLVENYATESIEPHTIIIGKRFDGTQWIINGQHHTEAALRLGISDIEIYSFKSDGAEHEAKVFKAFQEWQRNKILYKSR